MILQDIEKSTIDLNTVTDARVSKLSPHYLELEINQAYEDFIYLEKCQCEKDCQKIKKHIFKPKEQNETVSL